MGSIDFVQLFLSIPSYIYFFSCVFVITCGVPSDALSGLLVMSLWILVMARVAYYYLSLLLMVVPRLRVLVSCLTTLLTSLSTLSFFHTHTVSKQQKVKSNKILKGLKQKAKLKKMKLAEYIDDRKPMVHM